MDRTERFYKIDRLLRNNRFVSMDKFVSDLEASRATITRDIEYLRDRLSAPIVWNRPARGYCYEKLETTPLPGFWLTADETYAMLAMEHIADGIGAGLLSASLSPMRNALEKLLPDKSMAREVRRKVRLVQTRSRGTNSPHFSQIISALIGKKRLTLTHLVRRRKETITRVVSPQRLTFYKENWYLDAWCHTRDALRRFGLDAVQSAVSLPDAAAEIDELALDSVLSASYGIFGGSPSNIARLRFTESRSQWVSRETWHPEQITAHDKEGRYLLSVPYSSSTELVMSILRYGSDVEVLDPPELRAIVEAELRKALALYQDTATP